MANYCMNKLTVKGENKELKRFKTAIWENKDEPILFNKTVPMPPELEGTRSPSDLPQAQKLDLIMKYGFDNWYDWQVANWGCKWGAIKDSLSDPDETTYKNGKGKLIYVYDTPWCPPTAWIINTSKQFSTLRFENYCDEPGVGFKGTEIIINGKLIKNTVK